MSGILESLIASQCGAQGGDPEYYSRAPVHALLMLREDGTPVALRDYRADPPQGSKKKDRQPQEIMTPEFSVRTGGTVPFFLRDNAGYFFGVQQGSDGPERARRKFAASRRFHMNLLENADSAAGRALAAYWEQWTDEDGPKFSLDDLADTEALAAKVRESGWIAFADEHGRVMADDPGLQRIWAAERHSQEKDVQEIWCPLLRQKDKLAELHPHIRVPYMRNKIPLVSFNSNITFLPGRTRGANAGIGRKAAKLYAEALENVFRDSGSWIAFRDPRKEPDLVIAAWAENGPPEAAHLLRQGLEGSPAQASSDEDSAEEEQRRRDQINKIRGVIQHLADGTPQNLDDALLDPNVPFAIAGFRPTRGRLAVVFFERNTLCGFAQRLMAHQQRLALSDTKEDGEEWYCTFPRLLQASVRQEKREPGKKRKPPVMPHASHYRALLEAVIWDRPYPTTILSGMRARIRAEGTVTRERAAYIKAFYLRSPHPDVPKEVLAMSLVSESTNPAYNIGRLMSVLESLQRAAVKDVQGSVTRRYMGSVSSATARTMGHLMGLSLKHLETLRSRSRQSGGLATIFESEITAITEHFGEKMPKSLTMAETDALCLGYFHQQVKTAQDIEKRQGAKDSEKLNELAMNSADADIPDMEAD